MSLDELNAASSTEAADMLTRCCSCEAWVEALVATRPFSDAATLSAAADAAWSLLGEPEWLEAFAGHPKIGDVNSLRARYANTKALAAGEQSGVGDASEDVIADLATGNSDYEARFGFIFIVCATGKSAQEMLDLLRARLSNDRESELRIAAEEQRKIFQIRLEKLL